MATRKTTGKASPTTSMSDLGTDLASAYGERMAVRRERAALLPVERATASSDAQPQGSSPELASLAGRYLKTDTLSEEDVDNVRSLAASVLSQRMTD